MIINIIKYALCKKNEDSTIVCVSGNKKLAATGKVADVSIIAAADNSLWADSSGRRRPLVDNLIRSPLSRQQSLSNMTH